MKKIFTFIITAVLALSTASSIQASPAYPYPIKYTQPDGSVITIQKHGDEFCHWITDAAGNEVKLCDDGFYRKVDKPMSAQERQTASMNSPMREEGKKPASDIGKGEHHFLILLVQFNDDNKFVETNPRAAFYDLMNKTGYNVHSAKGSVKEYFEDNSNGQFRPIFDVYGPYTVDGALEEYGKPTDYDSDTAVARALLEACYLGDSEIDFTDYDEDKDGTVDNIFFFFAGYSEAEGSVPETAIWPHKWNVKSSLLNGTTSDYPSNHSYLNDPIPHTTIKYGEATFDGKKIDTYGCTSEFTGDSGKVMCGIGTFCHEFSHTIGLPDYYDTDYTKNGQGDGLFHYSLMSSGNYNGYDSATQTSGHIPPSYTAIDKVKMGWATWASLTSGSSYTLTGTAETKESNKPMTAYRTILSQSGTNEYFVYEARNGQKWDSPLSTGLLIYHVRESRFDNENYRNKYENNPGIYFKAAYPSSLNPPHASEANVPYPGPYNVTSFDNNSPSPATDWSGKWHGDALSDIQYNSTKHEVTFTYTKKDPNAKTLSGKVTDYTTGAAISGASIKVDYIGGSKSTTTSSDGSYSFYFGSINNPAFSVSISKSGYLSLDNDAFTHPGGDYIKDFTLIPSSAATDGLELKRYRTPSSGYIHGITNATDVIGCIKFSSAEMKPFVGMKITEISFKVYGNPSNECAVAWFGAEQVLNQSVNHVGGEFNTVMVNNGGLTIPEGKDIYVGYSISGVELPYIWDETTTNNDGCYVRKITESSWTNWSDKGSLLISFKVQENSQVEHDIMYELGYSGLNLEPGKTYTKPKYSWSDATTIGLSMAESSDPIKSVIYYFDDTKQSGDSISIGYNTTKGDHTIRAEVTYQSGRTETIIQVIKVQ